MIGALILGCGLLTALPSDVDSPPNPSPTDLKTYEAAASLVKRDPDAHVKLALWCERHGLEAERIKHLALAVLIQRDHATARGLLGQIADSGKWRKPDEIARRAKLDVNSIAYRMVRDKILVAEDVLRDNVQRFEDAIAPAEKQKLLLMIEDNKACLAIFHQSIGEWCAEQGMKEESIAHAIAATRYDPRSSGAWKALGYHYYRGRWMPLDQLERAKARESHARATHLKWSKTLLKYRADLRAGDKLRRLRTHEHMSKLDDSESASAVWSVFAAPVNHDDQGVAIETFRRLSGPISLESLAAIAVNSPWDDIRAEASRVEERDQDAFVGILLDFFKEPLRYEVRSVGGPGLPGELFIEGKNRNVRLKFTPPPMPKLGVMPGDIVAPDSRGNPAIYRAPFADFGLELDLMVLDPKKEMSGQYREIPIGSMIVEAEKAAMVSQAQLRANVAALERHNDLVKANNVRVSESLRAATGRVFRDDPESWRAWWCDRLGYAYDPPITDRYKKSTYFRKITSSYQATPVDGYTLDPVLGMGFVHVSCFVAGTPVHTREGLKPIETIRIGDMVLSRDVNTGALGYHAVFANTHTPKTATLRLTLSNGETIVATLLHRFWIAGKGWTIARDLKPGDMLRDLAGRVKITAVLQEKAQDVFNFEVESDRTYFVGKRGVLVHDNSVAAPVEHPFDAAPDTLAAAK